MTAVNNTATPSAPEPALSWDGLAEMHARITRPEPWTEAVIWAVHVLRATLGEPWAVKASRAAPRPPLWSALVAAKSNMVGAAEVLEWALRLYLLADVDGIADVRRDLSRNVTVGRSLHTQLQLEVAGHARRLGRTVRLEPAGSSSPGDVAFDTPGRSAIAVETRVLTEKKRTRDERAVISALTDRLSLAAMARGLWLAGDMRRMPTEDETTAIERWILATDMGAGRRLRSLDGIELYLVPRDVAEGHTLRSPAVTDRLLPRMVGVIGAKAQQMKGSGAGWMRLTALTGLWNTTQWGRGSLAEKLSSMAAALGNELGQDVIDGIVLSSAAGYGYGQPDESVTARQGIAARRAIAPLRARETLVMPFTAVGRKQTHAWLELVDAESDWLDWALRETGLGSVSSIFGQ